MKYQVKKLVGKDEYVFDCETTDTQSFFEEAAFFSSLPTKCGGAASCTSRDLVFMHRKPKGYDYYSIQCRECLWELDYGEHLKDKGGGLFVKKWREPYRPEGADRPPDHEEYVPPGDAPKDFAPAGGVPDPNSKNAAPLPKQNPQGRNQSSPITPKQRALLFKVAKDEWDLSSDGVKDWLLSKYGDLVCDDEGRVTTTRVTQKMLNELLREIGYVAPPG